MIRYLVIFVLLCAILEGEQTISHLESERCPAPPPHVHHHPKEGRAS